MPSFNASNASVHVLTEKDGLLSAVAHDLELAVTDFTVTADSQAISAKLSPASLKVLHALKGGAPTTALSDHDKADIQANIGKDVLDLGKEITFVSTSVATDAAGAKVAGTLTINGTAKAVSFQARLQGGNLVADIPVHQPDFGIKPYSAMMGTLKVKPGLVVRVSLPSW
jgi:hypothetical protein